MLHKLLIFPKLIRSSYLLHNNNKLIVNTIANRLYSKSGGSKNDGGSKKTTDKVCVDQIGQKRPVDSCSDQLIKRKPCLPCAPGPVPKSGPMECYPGNKMDQLPVPMCPYDPAHEAANKRYMKHLLIGILFTAATLAALWYNLRNSFTKKSPEHVEPTKLTRPSCKIPVTVESIPKHVPYLLIGGGTASFSAFRAIKSADPTAKVLVVSNECYFPYMRPPLSKEVWYHLSDKNVKQLTFKQWNGTERSLFYEPNDFYVDASKLESNSNGGVALIQGYNVTKIDVVEKKAILDDKIEVAYDKCLIATGARPKTLPIFLSASNDIQKKITVFRDIYDYQKLNEICKESKSIAIIGGGFLGSELACALGKISKEKNMIVYQIFKEKGNMGKILPEYLSEWTTDKIRKENVSVITETQVEDVTLTKKGELILHLNNGKKLNVNHVVCAIGVQPNTDLAKTSDLEIDPEHGGFLVNAEMEARSNLYVAGDCSCFYDVRLGRRRVEHHDHAVVTGRLAGENMTGAQKPYEHQSMFWSDLGPKIGYEAVGHVDASLPTVAVFAKAGMHDTPQAAAQISNTNLRSEAKELTKSKLSGSGSGSDECGDGLPTDEYGKGVIFYLKNDIVVGIVLWNVFNRMSIARQVLKDNRKYDDLNEVAKLFNIHED